MLCKLAWGNVRRAGRDYLVYLLTLTLAVTVFYAFNTISFQVDIAGVSEQNAGMGEALGGIISGLTVFLAIVMGFLMVYANNFIMKRRKKEFGLYQVLGMSRGQVARIMTLETLFVSLAALVLGLVMGLALSQLMVFFTASIFKTQIANFRFFVSPSALVMTVGCLVAIFIVTLVFNLRVVRRARIIDLMSAGRTNETIKTRNPWVSAVIFLVGLAAIVAAYVRLLHDGLPYDGAPEGMRAFGITTLIVVVGTILFFFGLSGFLLKALQGVRGLYWRGLNMVTLRQLAAKVNTVSLSMAVIAMILFLAITSVTTGMSLADTMNNSVERGTPVDYTTSVTYYSQPLVDEWNADPTITGGEGGVTFAATDEPVDVMELSSHQTLNPDTPEAEPFDLSSITGSYVQVDVYDSTPRGAARPLVTLQDLCDAVDMPLPAGTESSDVESLGLQVVRESNYNDYLAFRGMEQVDLGDDGYTLLSDMGETVNVIYNAVLSEGVELNMGGHILHPVQDRVNEDASVFVNSMMGMNSGTIVLPDALVDALALPPYTSYLLVNYADDIDGQQADAYIDTPRRYGDVVADGSDAIVGGWGVEATRTTTYESTDSMNGLISYLAIYIGFVLVVACAAILTIQQLSGVADASANYRILSELGCDRAQIAHSVLAQQTVFFVLPLAMGIAHSICALSVIIKLVALFGGFTIGGTVGLVTLIFLIAYGGYFCVTYLMGKGILRDATRARHAA
ncbi:FtsX-like permease family protein [Collinsella tanakaei]|uniref:FtsX-like permease family protein n=1 Tax=Collinsella tanakaei TaxID=626935 RepID=UPI0025A413FD|nr:ABC transporter permease [Collinsella tanakaei]MDM8300122.1 ABC transporter permease [Collinsella tanakaei]